MVCHEQCYLQCLRADSHLRGHEGKDKVSVCQIGNHPNRHHRQLLDYYPQFVNRHKWPTCKMLEDEEQEQYQEEELKEKPLK